MSVALAKPYSPRLLNKESTIWSVQAKLDGVRAIWREGQLFTRTGKIIHAPDWFYERMEDVLGNDLTVDGELIHEDQVFNSKDSTHLFQDVVSTVRKKVPKDEEWRSISFCAFDAHTSLAYRERLLLIESLLLLSPDGDTMASHCRKVISVPILGYIRIQDDESRVSKVDEFLRESLDKGFEGIMLRDINSPWSEKRTDRLLKVKPVEDDEATVIAIQEGEGKYKGMIGALVCESKGMRFKVGTGLTDEERSHGAGYWIDRYITYRFTERTRSGMPRHPAFVCIRDYD